VQILKRNLKEGFLKLMPENLDDLWYLKSMIEDGDLVKGKGYRRIRDDSKTRADKGTRKPMTLDIRVDGVEFHRHTNRLRVSGVIESGPEDLISLGSHHTLEFEPNEEVGITKQWKRWQLDRINEAVKSSKAPLVLIVAIEEGEADFAVIRRHGIEFGARITTNVSGKKVEKEHEVSEREFYGKVAKHVEEVIAQKKVGALIIAGPGFAREKLHDLLKEKYPKVAPLAHLQSAGSGGRTGIHEVIKSGAVERVAAENRVALETKLVEEVMAEIPKDAPLAVYGLEEVKGAVKGGAAHTVLVSDVFLRRYENADKLIEGAKKVGAKTLIISSEHEAGERLIGIGGVAALLRYKSY